MCEIIRGEMCEERNVALDSRGSKCVGGETWDIQPDCCYREEGLNARTVV